MPVRPTAAVIALVALGVALLLLVSAIRRRRWTAIFRVVPALCLLGLVALLVPTIFGISGPHPFFNRPASVPSGTVIYYLVHPSPFVNAATLYAVQGQSGKTLWQRPMSSYDTYITSDDRTVYVVSFQIGLTRTTQVLALDSASGAVRWQDSLPAIVVSSAPLLAQGTLYLGAVVAGSPPIQQLVALRPADGARLWSVTIGPADGYTPDVFAAPDILFVQPSRSVLQARRVADGQLLWSSNQLQGQVVAGADAVFDLSGYGAVTAYDARTGAQRWQYGSHDFFHAGTFADGTLYVTAQHSGTTTDASGKFTNPETLYALDPTTGQVRWTFATQSANTGQLAAGPGVIYIKADDGIHALRPADGHVLWQSDPHSSWMFVADAPHIGSTLYLTDTQIIPPDTLTFTFFAPQKGQDYLYAVNAADGTADWGMPVGPVFIIYAHFVT